MKLSFNQTHKYSSLEEDLKYCEEYGFDEIELRLNKIKEYLKNHTIEELVMFFDTHRLKPYALDSLENVTFCDDIQYQQIKDDLNFLGEIGNKIGCHTIVVVPSFNVGDYTINQIKMESIRVLNDLADQAEKMNMRLAFEFVGDPDCSVNTLQQCYDIIKKINRESVGMVLDFFHFHSLGSHIEELKKVDPEKIFVVHIDDADDFPRGYLKQDKHRRFPGEGSINLDEILSTLKQIGYEGTISVELFRDEYDNWGAEEFIRTAKIKTENIVRKHFPSKAILNNDG